MCEIFAANAEQALTLNSELTTFFGDSAMHPHGWGLAVRTAAGDVAFHKEAVRASDSAYLRTLLARPVRASRLQAHIRYATVGKPSYENCHPFVGTDATGTEWSLVHNGSIFRQQLIEPYVEQAQGTGDSERVLLYLIDQLNRAAAEGATDFQSRFDVLASSFAALTEGGNKVNAVLDDGTYTYVHTNTEDDTLYYRRLGKGAILFCTRPLDAEGWRPLPKRQLFAFRDGRLVCASEVRGSLYHYDEDELNAFILAHAA